MKRVLVAVGGNALNDKSGVGNVDDHCLSLVCDQIVQLVLAGYLPVITFGNGPQVGNLLDMAETAARAFKAPVPLDVCVSWTQGEIGYRLAQALRRQLSQCNVDRPVMAVNTHVVVDPKDSAFDKPTKPVGRFISPEEAQQLYVQRGWVVGPDANRGYRRLVPSPKPIRILEAPAIANLVDSGVITLCCGGGGIPIAEDGTGIEAVIDKDFTSCLLAKTLGLENLIICTEVDHVYLNFGTPQQRPLHTVSQAEARQYMGEGHFAAGSMGPKIAALIDFLDHPAAEKAIITSLPHARDVLDGGPGTVIVREVSSAVSR